MFRLISTHYKTRYAISKDLAYATFRQCQYKCLSPSLQHICRSSTAMWKDSGSNLTAHGCVYRDGHSLGYGLHAFTTVPRSTQPCIPPGSLNRVPVSAGVKAGMLPLLGGRYHSVILYGMWVPAAVWQCTFRTAVSVYFTLCVNVDPLWLTLCVTWYTVLHLVTWRTGQ